MKSKLTQICVEKGCNNTALACRGLCWSCYSKGRRQGKWEIRYNDDPIDVNQLDLAYMSGFFDGEGSISLKVKTRPKVAIQVQIQISNSIKKPLEIFSKTFGGKIFKYHKKNKNELPQYKWGLNSARRSKVFIKSCMPYLKIKQDVGELALQALEIQIPHSKNNKKYTEEQLNVFYSIKNEIIRLNKCS